MFSRYHINFKLSQFSNIDCPIKIASTQAQINIFSSYFFSCISIDNPSCWLLENCSNHITITNVNIKSSYSTQNEQIFLIFKALLTTIDRLSYTCCGIDDKNYFSHECGIFSQAVVLHTNASYNIAENECGMIIGQSDCYASIMYMQISDSISTKHVVLSAYTRRSSLINVALNNCSEIFDGDKAPILLLDCDALLESCSFINNHGPCLILCTGALDVYNCYCVGLNTIAGSDKVIPSVGSLVQTEPAAVVNLSPPTAIPNKRMMCASISMLWNAFIYLMAN